MSTKMLKLKVIVMAWVYRSDLVVLIFACGVSARTKACDELLYGLMRYIRLTVVHVLISHIGCFARA